MMPIFTSLPSKIEVSKAHWAHIGRMGVQKTSTNWQNANKPMMNDDQSMSSCRHFAMVWILSAKYIWAKEVVKNGNFFQAGLDVQKLFQSKNFLAYLNKICENYCENAEFNCKFW